MIFVLEIMLRNEVKILFIMSKKIESWEVSGNVRTGEIKGKYQKEQPMFPYGCQWGCNRQNVVTKAGNSCGRQSCNEAWTKAKSWSHKLGLK